jgi:thiamine-monophosphate kinase
VEAAIAETVGSIGEFGLIRALASRMPAGPLTSVGIGDDSAVVTTPSGSVVAAVDLLLEGRHFRRSWSSAYDIGVKAAARSLADIAAMGALPTALLVAVALPGSLPASWALDLASGLASEADRAGAGIVGGDTASADSVVLSVTALGDLDGRSPVRRGGARAGDMVAVAGPLGHSAAGLALLAAGVTEADARFGALLAAHLRPAPPYSKGPEAARSGATAMIDVSDGLIADLGHIAAASGVNIDVAMSSLEPFLGAPLAEAALAEAAVADADARSTVLDRVLTGGEDHSLVATFPPSAALPPGWQVIGVVRSASGSPQGRDSDDGGRVTVDGQAYNGSGGWEHFR